MSARQQFPIAQQPFHEWVFPDGTLWASFHGYGEDYLVRFPGLADFEISTECGAVRCIPELGISDSTLEHLYLNQVLPLVLSKQGKLVFHAGAIETDVGALAFMGASRRGKSTLTASFAGTGFRFLTDDALLLEAEGGGYCVHPSHASIRLWEDSQQAVVPADVSVAPAVQYTPKARLLSGESLAYCSEPRTLRRVYFLGDGSAERATFQRMSPREALMGLVQNTFLLDIDKQQALATHFDRLSQMVTLPIYYRLDYPRRYEDLPSVRQAIIEHAFQENGEA